MIFPDLNVWLALTLLSHEHHPPAWAWYQGLRPSDELVFCRVTQLGFLRLLTTEAVARHETLNQREAWEAYDRWLSEGGGILRDEPFGLEEEFRAFAARMTPAPKEWTDSYLAAFAAACGMPIITFDKALAARAEDTILLKTMTM